MTSHLVHAINNRSDGVRPAADCALRTGQPVAADIDRHSRAYHVGLRGGGAGSPACRSHVEVPA